MKILFVDSSSDLPIQYLEPLRNRGWGVIRARSLEDADRMMRLHGDQLDGVVVGEKFVSFAERQEPSFVVLTREWSEAEIQAHQNSANPAVAYLSYGVAIEELIAAFHSSVGSVGSVGSVASVALGATGTDGVPVAVVFEPQTDSQIAELPLEDFSSVLSQKEPTRNFARTLTLNAPRFLLGGIDTLEATPEPDAGSTTILDRTQVADALGLTDQGGGADSGHSFEAELGAELGAAVEESLSPAGSYPGVPQYSNRFQHVSSGGGSDLDTLKNYLALREQDVAVLSGQFRSSQERVKQLEGQVKMERARSAELQQLLMKSEQKIKGYDQEKQIEFEVMEKQLEDLSTQLKDRTEKVRTFEAKLKMTHEEISRVKERVKVDIRKIRVREKELESQLEILKKDSSALIQARDEKILELKRKVDLLEFNMELVQEQFQKERQTADDLKMRLRDASEAMKHANGLLEQ
jgi:hypothetical protein